MTASTFLVSRNIGVMTTAPPPSAARNMLTTEDDRFITQDAVSEIMCDEVREIRNDFTHCNATWIHAQID